MGVCSRPAKRQRETESEGESSCAGAELLGPFRKAYCTSVSCRDATTEERMSKTAEKGDEE